MALAWFISFNFGEMFMKKLVSIFAVFVPIAILFSCHPDQLEGNPLIKNDGSIIDAPNESSSSLDSDESSSSEEPSSSSIAISNSSSSAVVPSSSSSLRLSSSSGCTAANNTSTQYCSNGEMRTYGTVVYGGGQFYKTVKIGNQTWMAQNLNYVVEGSTCYANSSANCATHGRLYSWSMAKSACPSGWHLPTRAEWDILNNYVGGSSTASRHLKATSGWNTYNGRNGGLDTYGFAALPSGYGDSNSGFGEFGTGTCWWTNNEGGGTIAYNNCMYHSNDDVVQNILVKSNFISVRCLQD
jgi:uncharacterized protein (TIGR02145 family)